MSRGEPSSSRRVGSVVRNNKVHDNQGNGIWTDIGNIYALVENNLVSEELRRWHHA